jgi:hypothetical protein
VRFAQVHKFSVYAGGAGAVALGAGGELPVASIGLTAAGVVASWFAEGDLLQSERYARALERCPRPRPRRAGRARSSSAPRRCWPSWSSPRCSRSTASPAAARAGLPADHALALLQLIAATVLGGGLSYALCFRGLRHRAPWAMTLGHLRREIEGNYLADARAGRAGVPIDVARILRSRRVVGAGLLAGSSLLAVPIFLLTAVIFVLFPRIGLGILSVRSRGTR